MHTEFTNTLQQLDGLLHALHEQRFRDLQHDPRRRYAVLDQHARARLQRTLVEPREERVGLAGELGDARGGDDHVTAGDVDVVHVPGAFEITLAAEQCAASGRYSAIVCLGAVIRGETPHFDYVCQGVTQGVMDVQLKFSKPIGFGVLMCDTFEQALARSGGSGSKEDKGFDAAVAALSLIKK